MEKQFYGHQSTIALVKCKSLLHLIVIVMFYKKQVQWNLEPVF